MDLACLIAEARRRLDDKAAPFLWDDDFLTLAANEAEREAAERALLIRDRLTSAICTIPLVEGVREYPLDRRVIDVHAAKIRMQRDWLRRLDGEPHPHRHWPRYRYGYDECFDVPNGIPMGYYVYNAGTTLNLVLDRDAPDPTLVTSQTYQPFIDLTVYRKPLNTLIDGSDEPEISEDRHLELVAWMLFLAYQTRDSDAGDSQRAADNAAVFAASFGEKIDAAVRRKQLRHRAPACRTERW